MKSTGQSHQTSLAAQVVKHLPTMRETQVQSLGWEDLLEKEMATHSGFLAWKMPRLRSPVGYSPWGRKESDTTERLHFHWTILARYTLLRGRMWSQVAPNSASRRQLPSQSLSWFVSLSSSMFFSLKYLLCPFLKIPLSQMPFMEAKQLSHALPC